MSNAPLTGAAFLSSGFKNKIHNGAFEVAQRGTSFVSPANGAYTLDRWSFNYTAATAATITKATDAPALSGLRSSLRATITTADASIAAGDLAILNHVLEGYEIVDLVGGSFNMSFWVRSSKTGVHCVSFRSGGGDRSFVGEYTVNAANTWERKTIVVPGGLPVAGTWDYTNNVGLNIGFALAAGTTHRTTPSAWQTGNLFASANQVNVLDTVGNVFALTGVQLERGLKDTLFDRRPFSVELALCQRYFEKSFPYPTVPAQNAGAAGAPVSFISQAVQPWQQTVQFLVPKRTTSPQIVTFSPNALTANWFTNIDAPVASIETLADTGFAVRATTPGGAGRVYYIHWTAAADL